MDNGEVAVSDLGLSAFLVTQGIPFLGLRWVEPHRAEFRFQASDDVPALITLYLSGQAQVAALPFKAALDELKRQLWRERETQS